jgi:sarcosine oxidase subunit alpha
VPERAEVVVRVDGRAYRVATGTSVAALLLQLGVDGGGRPVCGMGTCFRCVVEIDGRPHRRACLQACREGLEVRTRA